MRKILDIVGDYSGLDSHSGIPKDQLYCNDSDFLMLIEPLIQLMPKLFEEESLKANNICVGLVQSIDGYLENSSHEERIKKYVYALQRLCEVHCISNLDLGVLEDKNNSIRMAILLSRVFFDDINSSEIIKIVKEVLAIDSSLDHIIKPLTTERLYQLFYNKKISLEEICSQIYQNQDTVDVIYFIKRIQTTNTIEPNDVIQLFERYKSDASFIVFLQRLHIFFDKNQIKPNHEKKIFPGITKNHLRIGGKSIHIQYNSMSQFEKKIKNTTTYASLVSHLGIEESGSIYGLQYENGKYSLVEYTGSRYEPVKQYSRMEIAPFIQEMGSINSVIDMTSKEFENKFNGLVGSLFMVDQIEREELQRRVNSPSPTPISDISLLNVGDPILYSPFDMLSHTIEQVESGSLKDEKVITQEILSGVNNILRAICNRKNGRQLLSSGELNESFFVNYENTSEKTINSFIRVASKGKYRSQSEILSLLKNGKPIIETLSGIEINRENIDTIVQRFGYEYIQTPYAIIAGRDYQNDSEGSISEKEIQSYEYANKLEAIFQMISSSKNPPRGKIKIYGSEDQSYAFFYYAEKNVTIFVSNLYGKATYIFRGEISPNEIAKSSLLELAKQRTLLDRLYYNPDTKDAWLKRIIDALEPQKDAANILVRLYKEGILKSEHIGTAKKFNTFVVNWNAFISSGGPNGDFPLSDEWTDFVTNELVETGEYEHLRLISNRVEDSSISIAGIINALGGDKNFTQYKGMTYFLGDYINLLLQNQLYPDVGNMEMAEYLAEEVFQGAGASKNVKDWVDKLLQGDLIIDPEDLQSWTSEEIRSKYNIPVGIQTISTFGIKLKLTPENRTPHGIYDYIASVQNRVADIR